MDPIATRVATRFVHKAADERQKYPDGRLVPVVGDKVYQMVRGMFDTTAVIDGEVYKSGKGLRVKVVGGGGLIGQAPTGKTYKLSEYWTVRDDPAIKAREEERERLRLEKETKAQRMKELAELAIAAKAKELGLRKVRDIHDVKVGEDVYALAVLDHVVDEEPKVDVAKETVTGLGNGYFLYWSQFAGGNVTSGHPWLWWKKG